MDKTKIQVFEGGKWVFVFCHNPTGGIIITENHEQALPVKKWHLNADLDFFKSKFANHDFRTVLVDYRGGIVEINEEEARK
jgi:hypothetical protein